MSLVGMVLKFSWISSLAMLIGVLASAPLDTEQIGSGSGAGWRRFSRNSSGPSLTMNHLAVDLKTGSVYIGAVNSLVRLDTDLRPVNEVSTGPRLDDPRCTEAFGETTCSGGGQQRYNTSLTDNHNKVLVVDGLHGRLITCGSIFQGICQTWSLQNLSDIVQPESRGNTDYFIAANHPHRSTVSFAGPSSNVGQDAMYVATTYSGTTAAVRHAVPAISSRHISGPNLFRFTYVDGLTAGGTLIHLRRESIEKYLVTYVAGFHAAGFVYFFSTQPDWFKMENSGAMQPLVSEKRSSKLAQICAGDRSFNSYVEIPLRCGDGGAGTTSIDYRLIQSAAISRSDSLPRTGTPERDTGCPPEKEGGVGDVLVATFVTDQSTEGSSDHGGSKTAQSAVCMYDLVRVRQTVAQNVQRCSTSAQKYVGQQFGNRICVTLVSKSDEVSLSSSSHLIHLIINCFLIIYCVEWLGLGLESITLMLELA